MKLKLTESQFDRLKANLSEGGNDDRYYNEVEVKIRPYGGVLYKGMEINDISETKMKLNYTIDIEYFTGGIDGISLNNITGPSEIEAEIEYFVDKDNTSTDIITLQIDWSKLTTEHNNNGVISVGDELEINVRNDENGNLFVNDLNIEVYGL